MILATGDRSEAYLPLAEALLPFCKDSPTPSDFDEIREAFNLLGLAVSAVIDLWSIHVTGERLRPSPRSAAIMLHRLVRHFGLLIADPLSPLSASVRRKLARADLRVLFYLIMCDANRLIIDEGTSHELLGWALWKKVAEGIHDSPLLAPHHTFVMNALSLRAPLAEYSRMNFFSIDHDTQEAYDMPYALLDPDLPRTTYYFHSRHVYFRFPEDEAFELLHLNEPGTFQDVEFEPVPGAELDPWDYGVERKHENAQGDCSICRDALSEQKSVEFECKHAIHYECAVVLINGIDGYCNKCPECRHEICPKRQKRAKREVETDILVVN
jgi:hypothetical protein